MMAVEIIPKIRRTLKKDTIQVAGVGSTKMSRSHCLNPQM
jgi:hypothetical protein